MTGELLRSAAFAMLLVAPVMAAPQRVVFEGTEATQKWVLRDLNSDLPSDWSPYNFLVLEMKASSPQRFWLTFYSGRTVQRRQIQPMANVWIRAAVPLQYYRQPNRAGHDLASVGKVPRNSFWISTGGVYGPLNAVQEIGVTMIAPLGKPVLEIRSAMLAKDDPGSEIIDKLPVVDQFGQWIPGDWPRKIKNLDQLKKEWAAEEAKLSQGGYGYGKYGGYLNTQAKATGFFQVEKVDGKWWFVDPEGHLFFSTSSTGMGNGGGDSRLQGRENYVAAMPPVEPSPTPTRRPRTGFYSWNLARRHGGADSTKWIGLAMMRLDAWGLNTIGNWSDQRLWDAKRKAYQVNMRGWGMGAGYLGMPDVYSEEWAKLVDKEAEQQCAPRKNDPWLLGYFVANEPPWEGRESLVVDVILDRPPSAIQREAKAFLAAGDTPERRKQFIYKAFDRFLEVINAAIKRHDPNHLNLGLRFGGAVPPIEMLTASKSFDVYSMNVYSTQVDPKVMDRVYEVTGLPIIVGEFHFGVPERGLAAGLVQVRDQAERGLAYRFYVEQAASHPAFIGSSWFQWVDQPSLGRMDGENYNIGLVDVMDRPYPEMIEAMKTTHRRLQDVHSGKTPPYDVKPRPQ
ncbi:MAG TPA: hypothetical protein PKJ41_02990 [Bryobacteraceae bacterium]|nr:hypothetical protein [Bryobacteraceae bacterium]HPT28582.1 hypothetical protein [Bryobacteraceae bacterium]